MEGFNYADPSDEEAEATRDKKKLIMDFIDRMAPSSDNAHGEVTEEWNAFVVRQREAELNVIIEEEHLCQTTAQPVFRLGGDMFELLLKRCGFKVIG
ncbi:MAG: hypothetical protein J6W75_04750 [Bacteroidaceae bacterium]|nr:hypothetical protein [Bacteroidaceae bacterium]